MSVALPPAGAPPVPAGEDTLVGTQLGSFLLTRMLGRGGMGSVYLGEHLHIGSRVAVKVLHRHLAVHPDLVARFFAEARAVNLIGHENIVSIFDMSTASPDVYYFLMEYLEGQSLAALAQEGPLAPEVAIPILIQVCNGLSAAHVRGVIHRDLKPENIFLTRRGDTEHFVKLLDFGIAKLFASATEVQTRPGAIVGTPEYMAPEQATGEPVDGRIDLYALGVIAYRLATGRLPFTSSNMPSVLLMHRDVVPPEPVELEPRTGRAFSDVIMRALAKRPEERFQTGQEFRQALEAALRAPGRALPRPHATPAAAVPAPTPPRPAAPPRIRARVTGGARNLPGSLECQEVTRAGLFLCTPAAPPPLLTRLSLVLELEHEELQCDAEVVRHVTTEQARAWGMSPGFAVQFLALPPAVREALVALQTGVPARRRPPTPAAVGDDPLAERTLEVHRVRSPSDPYAFLSLPPDATFADLRRRGRELRRELEQLQARPLSPRQVLALEEALRRLDGVLEQVGSPQRRVTLDLARGNFRGVARCLLAGLTVSELEAARATWLQRQPAVEARSQIHLATGQAWEGRGQLRAALDEYERGLAVDPANLRLHQRYWAALKKLEAGAVR